MNDLKVLQQAWDQPEPPSHTAYTTARAALLDRASAPPPVRRRALRLPRLGVRLIAVGAMAVTIAAGVTVVQSLGGADENGRPHRIVPGIPPGPVANAQDLGERTAQVAAAAPGPRDGQWTYRKRLDAVESEDRPGVTPERTTSETWYRFDGKGQESHVSADGERLDGPADERMKISTYTAREPDALLLQLDAQIAKSGVFASGSQAEKEFWTIRSIMVQTAPPPRLQATLYRALARVPGIRLQPNAVDAAGRTGVAFAFLVDDGRIRQEIIIDPRTYRLLGNRDIAVRTYTDYTWDSGDHPAKVKAGTVLGWDALLETAFVDEPRRRP